MAGFTFKQFTIEQDLCAMKVGTDGCLLGAWAELPKLQSSPHIPPTLLDIGTGTGLISLMMAQRFPTTAITAIDIDEGAVAQTRINAAASPFAKNITVIQCAAQEFCGNFDAIVSNPPYFVNSLECPDVQRTTARHASTLTYRELMHSAYRLLNTCGEFSLIIPADYMNSLKSEAAIAGFHIHRECAVFTSSKRPAKRYLLSFTKQKKPEIITQLLIDSDDFRDLLKDFYLKF